MDVWEEEKDLFKEGEKEGRKEKRRSITYLKTKWRTYGRERKLVRT